MLSHLILLMALSPAQTQPIALHPENPHYFLFRGKPTVLISSTEHYGAVLNLDFEADPYLDELRARELNLTRLFSGTYREVPGSFKIRDNTLAPKPGRYMAPWARSTTPGESDGGNKFDLDQWDDAYFRRLKLFCTAARARGIVVELVLFCPLYEEVLWNASPMNARNNVNGIGNCPRSEVLSLEHADLFDHQRAFVRKVVSELNEFDNLYYEVCNEPYAGRVSIAWQNAVIDTIVESERVLPNRHLIAQNISNGSKKIDQPHPAVSIFNFHYARPPVTVGLNYGLNKVIGDDETGFKGTGDTTYRTEGWDFLIAGGALFDNLDYSFTPAHEDGTAQVLDPTPGGGGPRLRAQLKILKQFIEGFDFIKMTHDSKTIINVQPAELANSVRALSEPGRAYAVYVNGGTHVQLSLDLPTGRYRAEWINTRTGAVDKAQHLDHAGGRVVLDSPDYSEDVALRIKSGAAGAGEGR
jgi:hypothetical protein